jgi:hypothetical protein
MQNVHLLHAAREPTELDVRKMRMHPVSQATSKVIHSFLQALDLAGQLPQSLSADASSESKKKVPHNGKSIGRHNITGFR